MSEHVVVPPIDRFANTATGSQVDLISLVHGILPEYNANLSEYITIWQSKGIVVLGEGIALDDEATTKAHDQLPLESIDSALTEDPAAQLVLIWGIGHLASLSSGLIERGYDHIGQLNIDLALSNAQRELQAKEFKESQARRVALAQEILRQQENVNNRQDTGSSFHLDFDNHRGSGRKRKKSPTRSPNDNQDYY